MGVSCPLLKKSDSLGFVILFNFLNFFAPFFHTPKKKIPHAQILPDSCKYYHVCF